MCKSEDNLWKLLLSFNHVGSGFQTQIVRMGCKSLRSLSHLAGVTTLRLAKSVTQKIQLWVGILNPCVN